MSEYPRNAWRVFGLPNGLRIQARGMILAAEQCSGFGLCAECVGREPVHAPMETAVYGPGGRAEEDGLR